jgi:hypothetical protein
MEEAIKPEYLSKINSNRFLLLFRWLADDLSLVFNEECLSNLRSFFQVLKELHYYLYKD